MKISFKTKMFFAAVSMAIILTDFGFLFFTAINHIDQKVGNVVGSFTLPHD